MFWVSVIVEFNSHRKHPAQSESFQTDEPRWLSTIFFWYLPASLRMADRFYRARKWFPYSRWSSYIPAILTRSWSMMISPKTHERYFPNRLIFRRWTDIRRGYCRPDEERRPSYWAFGCGYAEIIQTFMISRGDHVILFIFSFVIEKDNKSLSENPIINDSKR